MEHPVLLELGRAALVAGGLCAVYAVLALLVGGLKNRPQLTASGRHAAMATWACVVMATASLVSLLLLRDFSVRYVMQHSSHKLPNIFAVTALWGGQEGSLLLWALVLTSYAVVHLLTDDNPYVTATLMAITTFFLYMLNTVSTPFIAHPVVAPDGVGLNPALQNPFMVIHPPCLYLGYVGTAVPFAFAVSALITGQLDATWLRSVRRWSLWCWTFLTVGNILGAGWAYNVLGWGGYWSWDPVENAALMPWLISTAFVHSVMVQEKRGMLRGWNISLVILAFLLSILGTFITRSGIISSVHSFAESDLGRYFFTFLIICIVVSLGLVAWRRKALKDDVVMDTWLSREGAFVINTWALVIGCIAVLIGTLLPILSELVSEHKMGVDAPFFNRFMVPIGILLLIMSGIGPLIAWRRATWSQVRKNLLGPLALGLLVAGVLLFSGFRHGAAVTALGACGFVGGTVVQEFWRATRARLRRGDVNPVRAFADLFATNRRRYGGYVVHAGMVMVFLGIAASSGFQVAAEQELMPGQTMTIGGYTLTFDGTRSYKADRRHVLEANLRASYQGGPSHPLHPRKDHFTDNDQVMSQVALWMTWREDLYVIVQSVDDKGEALVRAWINPMVVWIWVGGAIMVLGGLICMAPVRENR